jgi:GAF domain-containing protein
MRCPHHDHDPIRYETKTILCMPITHKGGVVGVLQIMNKKIGVFNSEDEELLKTFLEIIGSVISTTKLSTKKVSEGESAEGFNDGVQVHKASAGAASMETFGEEEEEED